jgi:phenylalanyl-tRNA synthetase beta chain
MKLPLNTAKQYTDISLSLEEILHTLSSKIGEVEGYQDWSEMYKGIYIGQIVTKKDHPDADKLGVYDITLGKDENIQVVAGDKTLEVGDKVAYIEPGNIVPSTYKTSEEFVIKAVKMRGILSNGMLCSEKELNLGPDHTKVLVLESDATVGDQFIDYYDLNDVVIDIENKALTNRGDLFGILGLARELSAAQGKPFVSPQWYADESREIQIDNDELTLEINNLASSICPRYIGVALDNIKVGESPVWLKSVLLKSGIRPINNVVDITNYISILSAQPLHAFDYDKVVKNDPHTDNNAHINIRLARDEEKIHTLDNNLVELNSNTLVIADSTNPIAIAGVIGGMDTEIDENTSRVILECANFDRFSIRKTSMSLGIFTDAVTRYTKAQDPNKCLPIAKYAIELIKEITGATVASKLVDIYPEVLLPKHISLSINKLNTHLGTSLSKEEITKILTDLEYVVSTSDEEYITVVAPTFRTDIDIPEDIHEDIARIYGYENIPLVLPSRDIKAASKNQNIELKKKIRNVLSNSGCNEVITYSFVSKELMERSRQDPNLAYHIKNAQSPDLAFMRTSLLTSLVQKAQENLQRNINTFGIYEFNISHQKGYLDKFELPKEDWHMSFVYTSRDNLVSGNPYYQLKRYYEKVVNTLGIEGVEYVLLNHASERNLPIWILNLIPMFNSKASVLITYKREGKEEVLGIMGDFNKNIKSEFKLPEYTGGLEINLDILNKLKRSLKVYRSSSKYPAITQDISFTVANTVQYKELENILNTVINTKKSKAHLECIDIYQGKDNSTKNITVRVSIEHQEKTLTDNEFEKIKAKVLNKISK